MKMKWGRRPRTRVAYGPLWNASSFPESFERLQNLERRGVRSGSMKSAEFIAWMEDEIAQYVASVKFKCAVGALPR